jgi:inorganic pyrophosphatase
MENKHEDFTILVLIEIPKGTRNKYEYDKELKLMRFDRMLFSAVHYPSDYGFILDTLGDDGDPLDAMVLLTEPTFPGCLTHWNNLNQLDDVTPHLLTEIEHFFAMYKELEKKKVAIDGWADRSTALEVIKRAQENYNENIAED